MLKRLLEYYLFFSRWLLAPFFIMLTLGLFALMVNAGRHVAGIFMDVPKFDTRDLVASGAMHLAFVASAFIFAYSERVTISGQAEKKTSAEEPRAKDAGDGM